MTDRDQFAAAALTGLLCSNGHYGSDCMPQRAFELADAMLRERDATPSKGSVRGGCTLTDAEREAVTQACDEGRWYPADYHHIHTLRGLLKRLG
jgi:hypothetical protein